YYRNKKAEWVLWDALDEAQEKQDFFKKKLDLWRDKKTFRSILFPVVSYVPMQLFFLLLRLLKVKFWGDMIAFFFLSIFQDAFITMTYLRHGCNNGLRIRDYMFFILSLAVSIGYWVVRNGLITELVIRPVLNF
ncbi:MAG TPA: hypothetical protein DEA27_01030, partial [Candidatus Moranbacteria bacterium]|nr:hypothetical protein [Candidatus Moranbacteria bacterium]